MTQILGPHGQPFARPRPDTRSIGFTGLNRLGGLVREEYVADLRGARAVRTYDRMRNDGLIQGLLNALSLPILAASWVVEPSGRDRNALRAAELVERQLFQELGCCWQNEVREFLTHLTFGFAVSIKQWEVRRGEVRLSELTPVHPRSILESREPWVYEGAKLVGCNQYGYDGQTWRQEFLPAERIVHLVHDQEFRSPEGRSILRAAYKHWFVKDTLYRIQAIGLERGAVGTPIGRYPRGTSEADQQKLEDFVTGIIAYEKGGGTFPEGYTVEDFAVSIKTADIMDAIHHHDAEIAKSVLAQFLNLGQEGGGGAYALSSDQTDLFLLSLQSTADYLAERVNRSIIPELVSYNLDTDQYPRLSATISRRSAAALAGLVRQLTAGTNAPLTWSEADEDWLREYLELPARTADRPAAEPKALPSGQESPKDGAGGADPQQHRRRERVELRVFADPPAFREEPAYPELGELIEQFHASIRGQLERLRADVWRIAELPEPTPARTASRRRFAEPMPKLTQRQKEAMDRAIARFISELAGPDLSEAGFANPDIEDALLQQYERLGHALGVTHARELTEREQAALKPSRNSPEIQALLRGAFRRLSRNSHQTLFPYLSGILQVLEEGMTEGLSPFEVADQLAEKFEDLDYDFERLARTEMAFAANQGSVDEWRAEGLRYVEPLVASLACPICTAHDGERIPVEQVEVGVNIAPYHPHCLCSVAPAAE